MKEWQLKAWRDIDSKNEISIDLFYDICNITKIV